MIDPTRWNPTHIGVEALQGDSGVEGVDAEGWMFESDEEGGEDEDGRQLVGRWVKYDGDEEEIEEVWVQGRRVQDEGIEDQEDELDSLPTQDRDRSASPLFGTRQAVGSASPLFGARRPAGSTSPLFPGRQASASPLLAEEDESSLPPSDDAGASSIPAEDVEAASETLEGDLASEEPAARSNRSASPLFPTRHAPKAIPVVATKPQNAPSPELKPIIPPQSTVDGEPASHALPDPVREVALAERSRDLGLLASFLGEAVSAPGKPTKGEWAGFDEDDDEDDEDIYPLRLRGGAANSDDEEMDGSSSSDSSEDSDSSDDNESEDENDKTEAAKISVVPAVTKVEPAVKVADPTSKPQSALKAMFAPAPATSSFSLLGALDADIELDEELDIPLAPPPIYRTAEPEPELQPLSQSKKSHFDPDPSIPLFFPSFGKGGKDAMREETTADGYVGFWKQETDEEMKEIWEKDKLELTRDWKKRYREGKKQKKRRGGANDVE